MNIQEFVELTRKTRVAQKLFYKTRLQGDLIAAKQLESQLDKALTIPLEPDATVVVHTTKEYQQQLDLMNAYKEPILGDFVKPAKDEPIDFSCIQDRRNGGSGDQPT